MKKIVALLAALSLWGSVWAAETDEMSHEEMVTGYYYTLAQDGSAYAQLALGEMYFEGEVVPKDLVKAFAWLSVSAQQDVSEAADLLAKVEKEISAEERARAEPLAQEYIESYGAPS